MLKKVLSALVLAATLSFGTQAQTIQAPAGFDVSGNARSPVITILNQSFAPVIAITCGPFRIPFSRPIPSQGASNVNFSGWTCPAGSHISVFTADGQGHFIPFVDIRNTTLITIPNHW